MYSLLSMYRVKIEEAPNKDYPEGCVGCFFIAWLSLIGQECQIIANILRILRLP